MDLQYKIQIKFHLILLNGCVYGDLKYTLETGYVAHYLVDASITGSAVETSPRPPATSSTKAFI